MLSAYFSGIWIGLSLIVAIGAQNAFVLKQGLKGEYVLPVVMVCIISDMLLIGAGIAGFGSLLQVYPQLEALARYAGAVFLFAYAIRCFYHAYRCEYALNFKANGHTWQEAVLMALVLTWLNPHVYLDTVVLLGAVGLQFGDLKWYFGAGAMTASVLLFVSLGYGARLLQPWFIKPKVWIILDVLVGLLMFSIAWHLVFQ